MKNVMTRCLLILLALLVPAGALLGLGFLTPSQYGNTFLGELSDKYNRLYSIEEPKIILIGGSSVAFGYDTELMQERLDMPVVNFGLYASLGTKIMLDLAADSIGEGDIVILAPEMDAQTLSLYFNGESLWQAADSDFSLLAGVDYDNYGNLLGTYWGYVKNKIRFLKTEAPDPEGVYNEASFDEYGDISYERPYNQMELDYDPTLTISLDPSIVDAEFADYVNEYIRAAEKKGATLYFTFSPMNELALTEGTTDESLWEFYDYLCRTLDCEVISNINDCIMDAGYFYDSNFHLNDSGVIVRTASLIKDIRRARGITTPVDIVLPEVPEKPEKPVEEDKIDPNDTEASLFADCFTYEAFGEGLMITGVTDKGKTQTEMTVPAYYEGKEVLAIGEYAFRECTKLERLTLQRNIISIYSKAFAACPTLKTVRLETRGDKVLVNNETLLDETSSTLRFSVSEENYSTFVGDYFWTPYTSRFIVEE